MRPCLLIPVYNHGRAIAATVASLRPLGLPILLVDDGSEPTCAAELDRLALEPNTLLERLPINRGKGGALKVGLTAALRAGFSHALQIDADGQHDATDVPRFLAEARAHPDALINGRAVYDHSVPKLRHYGRYLTHIWVWINTLSLQIPDSMCGLRLYPLQRVVPLIERIYLGERMEFDTEILVRAYWAGIAVRSLPARVHYPSDGVSHFRVWRDNARISAMHARLFVGMLPRSPKLLARHFR